MKGLEKLFNSFGETVKAFVERRLEAVFERLEALEKRPEAKDGQDGAPGANGADGAPGADGKDGESAYEVAKRLGFAGGEADFVASLRGEPGKDGRDGRDGRDGKDGIDGRDAGDLEILPGIDEARSYPKGTWASHNGGVWVARKKTNGMDGWDCIVNGYQAIEIEWESERSLCIAMKMSNGQEQRFSKAFPVLIDRGVFREGNLYKAGDCVSFGGSIWTAKEDTDSKPGEGPDSGWRLAVKRGRDGKDGINGKHGRDGLNGKDWTGKRVE